MDGEIAEVCGRPAQKGSSSLAPDSGSNPSQKRQYVATNYTKRRCQNKTKRRNLNDGLTK